MSNIIVDNYIIEEDLEHILTTLQSELLNGKLSSFKKTSSGYKVPCPHHADGKESHPSCYINDDTGVWHCFTCGEKGKLYHFIAECFDKNDGFGKKWLISHFGHLLLTNSINLPDFDLSSTLNKNKETIEYLDESILENMQSFHPYMNKRHLNKDICEKFKVKYDSSCKCLVFPV